MAEIVFAIDPGTHESGWCLLDGSKVVESGVVENVELLHFMRLPPIHFRKASLAIEMIASYGMPVGKEVFETCVWIGRFIEAWGGKSHRVYRKEVKLFLCGTTKAKDANVRQALIDLFPPTGGGKTPQIGTKAAPGPLYGVTSHAWAALAVAVTFKAAA